LLELTAISLANYSLFAIPAYWAIAMVPHVYSVYLVTKHNNNRFDTPSPRSTGNRDILEKSIPKEVFRKYERCRAAHDNMLENMGAVVGGILSGVVTRLDADLMNTLSTVLLATRVVYLLCYINISSRKWATLRTLWFL
jgi:uncharacterized MAPEG superfamily protein